MERAAKTLADARRNCGPQPLSPGEGLEDFWVETESARDAESSFRLNLLELLEQEGAPKVLVHGHRGCGKSTEINKFVSELPDNWLVVRVNVGDFLATTGNEAADVLLAAATALFAAAEERKLPINPKSLEHVLKYFCEVTETRASSSKSTHEGEAGADASKSILTQLFGLRAKLVSALKFESRTEESIVRRVRRSKGELCKAVNGLCLGIEQAWKRHRQQSPDTRVLLIVEELDKLGLADARQIFVNDGRILAEVTLRAIYTIPVFTFHSADAGAIRSYFEHDLPLPMIKVVESNGEHCKKGRKILRSIVRRRVAPSILPDDALEELINRTGGVLRDLFEAIRTAAGFKSVREGDKITREAVKGALDRMVGVMGVQIAYPPEDKKSPRPLQERLAELAKQQKEGKRISTQPDPDLQLLLMSGALIEYNGERWLGVHPLALQYIQGLGLA
jgi:hypothetical protein